MSRNPFSLFRFHWMALAALVISTTANADTIILKSGEKFEGDITYESNILVKIAVPISASINETKTIAREDIAEIIKVAPDAEAFNEIQSKIPTPPLLSASDYSTLIEKGPTTFKAKFPDSQFLPKVKEIEATLLEELDKVERGFIKLDGKWISPQERRSKEMLIDSRIRKYRFDQYTSAANYIGAMREFAAVEQGANGTPAHAEMLKVVPDLLRSYGSFLTKKIKNVDYLNAQEEEAQKRLDATQLAQVQKARANEVARYEALEASEKEAGIKWLTVDQKSRPKLEEAIKVVTSEIERIEKVDAGAIASKAEKLVAVDDLIFKEELEKASDALKEIGIAAKKTSTKSTRTSAKTATYEAHIATHLGSAIAAKEEAARQAIAADDAKEMIDGLVGDDEALNATENSEDGADADSGGGALAAAMAAKKKASQEAAEKRAAEEEEGQSAKSSKDRPKSTKGEDRESRPPVSSGGGFSFQYVLYGIVALLIIAVIVVKVMGIGGKKESADS